MANPWMAHVKKTMKKMLSKKSALGKKWFSHVLNEAKHTYKKGGADEPAESPESVPVAGRRRTRRRRHHKK
uniref:Uncharacterized protein n=1 Tax=viral metagenome TaxID=1070528 RepID=A0A6C0JWF6_9ZZZZ